MRPTTYQDPSEEILYSAANGALNRWKAIPKVREACPKVPKFQDVRSFVLSTTHLLLITDDDNVSTFCVRDGNESFYTNSRVDLTNMIGKRCIDVRYGAKHFVFLTINGDVFGWGTFAILSHEIIPDVYGLGEQNYDWSYNRFENQNQAMLIWDHSHGKVKSIRCGLNFTALLVEIDDRHRVVVFGENPQFNQRKSRRLFQLVSEELNVNNPVAIEAGNYFLAILTASGEVAVWKGNSKKIEFDDEPRFHLLTSIPREKSPMSNRVKPPSPWLSVLVYGFIPKVTSIACCASELIMLNSEHKICIFGPHTFSNNPNKFEILDMIEGSRYWFKNGHIFLNSLPSISQITAHDKLVVMKVAPTSEQMDEENEHAYISQGGLKIFGLPASRHRKVPTDATDTFLDNFEHVFGTYLSQQTTPRLYHLKPINLARRELEREYLNPGNSYVRPLDDFMDSVEEFGMLNAAPIQRSSISFGPQVSNSSPGTAIVGGLVPLDPPRIPGTLDFRDVGKFRQIILEGRRLKDSNDYDRLRSDMRQIVLALPGVTNSTARISRLTQFYTEMALPYDIQDQLRGVQTEAAAEAKIRAILLAQHS